MQRIGNVQITRLDARARGWVIGGAPKGAPYWTLRDAAGEPVARLVLLFADDRRAIRAMEEHLDRVDGRLKDYIERTLRDLRVSSTASVGTVAGGPELLAWMQAVVNRRDLAPTLPDALASLDLDMILLPRRLPCPGQLAVVRMSALDVRVRCENHRTLRWAQ